MESSQVIMVIANNVMLMKGTLDVLQSKWHFTSVTFLPNTHNIHPSTHPPPSKKGKKKSSH